MTELMDGMTLMDFPWIYYFGRVRLLGLIVLRNL